MGPLPDLCEDTGKRKLCAFHQAGWKPKTEAQKIEFMKKVMENEEHMIDEHLVTKQELLKLPLVRWRIVQKLTKNLTKHSG